MQGYPNNSNKYKLTIQKEDQRNTLYYTGQQKKAFRIFTNKVT